MASKKIVTILAMAFVALSGLSVSETAHAKRTPEEQAAKDAEKSAKKAEKDQARAAKDAEKAAKETERAAEKAAKDAAKEAERAAKEAEKAAKRAEKEAGREQEQPEEEEQENEADSVRVAAKSDKASRVRLQAVIKLDEQEGDEEAEVENGREMKVRFESRGDRKRLRAQAENFADGTVFEVFIGTTSLGQMTVSGGEAKAALRDEEVPAALEIKEGTVIRFVGSDGTDVSAPLAVK